MYQQFLLLRVGSDRTNASEWKRFRGYKATRPIPSFYWNANWGLHILWLPYRTLQEAGFLAFIWKVLAVEVIWCPFLLFGKVSSVFPCFSSVTNKIRYWLDSCHFSNLDSLIIKISQVALLSFLHIPSQKKWYTRTIMLSKKKKEQKKGSSMTECLPWLKETLAQFPGTWKTKQNKQTSERS